MFSYSDKRGGAAIAAFRLADGLQTIFPTLQLNVFDRVTDASMIKLIPSGMLKVASRFAFGIDAIPVHRYRNRNRNITWSTNWFPYRGILTGQDADLYHLHWVGSGMIPVTQLRSVRAPIIWTMHDEWPFTGGCHYTAGCQRFETSCGACPQLGSQQERDLSRSTWSKKQSAWRSVHITPVAPSRWLGEQARKSSVFGHRDIRVIPNGLDLSIYRPIEKILARRLLQLPEDKYLVLFGASRSTSDPRKGFAPLMAALERLPQVSHRRDQIELVVFGASSSTGIEQPSIPIHYVGTLHDDLMLALLYSAADVFVAPSLQDNLPNTIMEALACGTPVVGFHVGGIPDLIEHEANGYLAAPSDPDDLARGISWVLEDSDRWQSLSVRARQKCEQEFEISHIARRYVNLYEEVLEDYKAKRQLQ